MDDLADQLVEAQAAAATPPTDQYGLVIPPNKTKEFYDYLVERALCHSPTLHTEPPFTPLYLDRTPVWVEDRSALASILGYYDRIPSEWVVYIYEQIRLRVPQLDRTRLQITSHLLWNYKKQSFEYM